LKKRNSLNEIKKKMWNKRNKSNGIRQTYVKRVWRYQRGNQKPYIEEGQTTQWPKEKWQKTIYKTYT